MVFMDAVVSWQGYRKAVIIVLVLTSLRCVV